MKKGIAALVGAAVAATSLLTACRLSVNVEDYLFDKEEDYTALAEKTVELDADAVSDLDLDWVSGEIEIKEGDKLTVTEENLKGTYYPLYYSVKDGTLSVKFCKSGTIGRIIGGCSKKITVTLPEGMNDIKVNSVSAKVYVEYGKKLENVTVNSVSGDVTASVGKVDKFTSDVVSAAALIITFEAEEITSNAVSGNVRILGDPKEVKTHSVSGDSHIYAGNKDLKSVKIDTISGDAEIMLDGTRDYSLEYNTVSGKLTNDVGEIKNVTGDKIEIKMDSVSGDLRFMKTAD